MKTARCLPCWPHSEALGIGRVDDPILRVETDASGCVSPFRWTVNGATFDPGVIGATVQQGATEIWQFENQAIGPIEEMDHPVHVHMVTFLVLIATARRQFHPSEAGRTQWSCGQTRRCG